MTSPAISDSSPTRSAAMRSEEHTSELQSQSNLVCRLLLEKKHDDAVVRGVVGEIHVHVGVGDTTVKARCPARLVLDVDHDHLLLGADLEPGRLERAPRRPR